ncbi:aldo/keto reductase [Nonomuraea terrae]|uniref:aldo/keto reductase n=1 Tax=Nonomuraea terrae TaxID=2530383 RepID=UPI001FE99289|nr:aldo/keto reductase [Nonomuraea terrae]
MQLEYSLLSRGIEREILPVCRELGVAVTAYGVLSRGLISGHWSKERSAASGDFRGFSPRFSGGRPAGDPDWRRSGRDRGRSAAG